ncbi:hypothetical protein H312_01723 [Anncaliia algerae PRA339]|uniref:Uncharacterized protein n=1 Tax=Anncaliia algerae PRA339 TaxID=1288291 RepID=A0A059F0Z2_9MICR|nr:hypothetical protein H312_01723 [Anncaliia algerae PRA339]
MQFLIEYFKQNITRYAKKIRERRTIHTKDKSLIGIKNLIFQNFIHYYNEGISLEDILAKGEFNLIGENTLNGDEKEVILSFIENFIVSYFIKFIKYIKSKGTWCCGDFLFTSEELREIIKNYANKIKNDENKEIFLFMKNLEYATYIRDHQILLESVYKTFKLKENNNLKGLCEDFLGKMRLLCDIIVYQNEGAEDKTVDIILPYADLLQSHVYKSINSKLLNMGNTSLTDGGIRKKNICKSFLEDVENQNSLNITSFQEEYKNIKGIGISDEETANKLYCSPYSFLNRNPYEAQNDEKSLIMEFKKYSSSEQGILTLFGCSVLFLTLIIIYVKLIFCCDLKKSSRKLSATKKNMEKDV